MPNTEISFETDGDDVLTVTIETERLQLTSVKEGDLESYYSELYSDPKVMELYGTGDRKSKDVVENNVKTWTKRWEMNDPFSSFAVRKKEIDEFTGQVTLGHDEPGAAHLAYLFSKKNWGQGIGSEAVVPVVKEYAPELVRRNYEVDGKPFSTVVACARPDNPGSVKILEKSGMEFEKAEERFGAMRNHYRKSIKHP